MRIDDVWEESTRVLRLARRSDRCTVLGPGVRAVLWVQGCVFRCPGCVVDEMLPFHGGHEVEIDALADELASLPDIEGVTFSGGEPFSQALALSMLIDRIRSRREMSYMSYTGYTLEDLEERGMPAQRSLLSRLDILVDGPYVASRHTDLRWRGSDNQRVVFISDRYRHLKPRLAERGYALEFEFPADGSVQWMGIPPRYFRADLQSSLAALGIELAPEQEGEG